MHPTDTITYASADTLHGAAAETAATEGQWQVRYVKKMTHADSVARIVKVPRFWGIDTKIDTDLESALNATYSTAGIDTTQIVRALPPPKPTWQQGLEGTPRPINAGDNSGVLTIVTGIFVLMMLSYRSCSRLFSTLFKELLGTRTRANVFDEHTSNETWAIILMAMQWSVYTGLLLYTLISAVHTVSTAHALTDITLLIGLTGAYYIFQACAYRAVGYTFSTAQGKKHFVEGFTSSQSLLGFLLIVPALVAIFYHSLSIQMLIIGGIFYFLARIIFILKGFRIFYHKFSSLFYFILYLCTLEIIPLIVLYNLALSLVNSD